MADVLKMQVFSPKNLYNIDHSWTTGTEREGPSAGDELTGKIIILIITDFIKQAAN